MAVAQSLRAQKVRWMTGDVGIYTEFSPDTVFDPKVKNAKVFADSDAYRVFEGADFIEDPIAFPSLPISVMELFA